MVAPLRSIWHAPGATPPPPRRVWRDWALVAAVTALAVIEGILRPNIPAPVLSVIVLIAVAPTLLWRRTYPLAMIAIAFITTGVVSAFLGGSIQLFTSVFLLLLPYSLVRWGNGRALVIGLPLLLASAAVPLLTSTSVADVVGGLTVLLVTISLGLAFRFRASSRQRELESARLIEREQLARDLHDTVAHHVSAIAIRAQAGLAMAPGSPEAATDALRVIEAEASKTLSEMRSMVRILRQDEAAALTPNPRVADLALLAQQPGQGSGVTDGPAVDVHITGDVESIPPTVAAAIYRLVQESITNARRHAVHATRIAVLVDADEARVSLSVSDDGEAGPPAVPGYGIRGMIERATLLGGTCQAGRAPGNGWVVSAVLPRAGWST
ncbi:sensor histidine kinase [Leifsonia sp. YAF41]|uniref:sensor histidine kinase n=1 Tax=Leifsonia sp. YAF41 TaxID=3233086 RepID=UPI003F9A5551